MARGKTAGRYTPRRRGRDEGDSDARWLTTYGDAVTLLMAFFIMLYAMSQIDIVKFEAFVRGLEVPFGNPAATEGLLDLSNAIVADTTIEMPPPVPFPDPVRVVEERRRDREQEAEPEEDVPPTPRPDPSPRQQVPPPNIDLEQLEEVRAAVDASLRQANLDHLATYRYEERGLVVSIAADDILFDTGSTRISRLGRSIVAAVAVPLSSFPNDVLVEGHTDDVPLDRGGYTNWNLSTDRAVAVLSLLATEHRIEQPRLGAVGYGEFRPIVPNDSPAHRSMNRRVDILVVGQGA